MSRPPFETLIHVPGPNPILRPGIRGAWDDSVIEACNAFKDQHTYYLYYHGVNTDVDRWGPSAYRLGVATAAHPLGPWTKHGDAPILDLGSPGSWEARHVACAAVIKERENTYLMWYSGCSEEGVWGIGLATASSPLGPWERHPDNPLIEQFGYMGAVVNNRGTYMMYTEHPIGGTSPDQGPFCLATAQNPEGPWELHFDNPVLPAGEWGSWDDGGFSEAGMLYHEGLFHTFYGGTKWHKLESIGYAYSREGRIFDKYPGNPVVMRERCPDVSAMAEVHALFEPPLLYLYHTIRYISRPGEDIGVHILATRTPFRFEMPLMALDELAPGQATDLDACSTIGIENLNTFSLSVQGRSEADPPARLVAEVFASHDGLHFDTAPMKTEKMHVGYGKTSGKSFAVEPLSMFAKVRLHNEGATHPVTGIDLRATLGCV